jgi:hypothetical protein
LSIANSIGEALHVAHAADAFHGDVTPESIFISGERAELTGFGAGLVRHPELGDLLHDSVVGLAYAAPEAAYDLQPRSDLYSFAATLYLLLTGQAPTPAAERTGDAQLMEITWLNSRISPRVAQAVMTALELSPEARPASVPEFLHLLRQPLAVTSPELPLPADTPQSPRHDPLTVLRQKLPDLKVPKIPRPLRPAPPEAPQPEPAQSAPTATPASAPPRPAPVRSPSRRVVHSFGAGQTPRVRIKLQGQDSEVLALSFSADSTEIMSVGADHRVRIWDTQRGDLRDTIELRSPTTERGKKRVEANFEGLHCAAIAPDGDMAACGYENGRLRLWNLPEGNVRHTLHGHAGRVNDVMFSSDGIWLASGSNDSTTMVWETEAGEEQQTMSEESDGVRVLAFSEDDRWIATGGDRGAIRLWNAWTSDLAWQEEGHEFWATSLAFAGNGKILASGSYDRTIRLWSVAQGQPIRTLTGHEGCVVALAFHPDGNTLASAGLDATMRLWHAPSGQLKHTLGGYDEAMRCIAFSPDGSTLASAGEDQIRLWQGG